MEPELIATIAVAASGGLATIISEHLRGLLRSIFRRPRETSVIVEIDGKRAELSGTELSPEVIEAFIHRLRTEDDASSAEGSDESLGGASHD
ncbi:hypothetical protein [Streptomyces sp. NPDC006668]|uniref:hypothetical protein n=1 Tax=Streptomyces sp. NPDC006668 TaxID=3156903 RepID=UPI00340F65FD